MFEKIFFWKWNIFYFSGNIKNFIKLGCVVRMVVDSILLHAGSGPNDHLKDASLFTKWKISSVMLFWLPVIHYLFLTRRWVDSPTIIHLLTGIIEEKNLLGWEKVSIFTSKDYHYDTNCVRFYYKQLIRPNRINRPSAQP